MIAFLIIGMGLGWLASWVLVAGAFAAGMALAIVLERRHPSARAEASEDS
jgi:hypothetical protein